MKGKLFGCFKSYIKQHVSTIRRKSSLGFLNKSLKIIKDIIKIIQNNIGTEIKLTN